MVRPNSLERMLKSLEGHVVKSVEIEREDGFLQVTLSVVELETLEGPKDLLFSVMWKKDVEERMNKINSQLGMIGEKLKKVLEDRKAS